MLPWEGEQRISLCRMYGGVMRNEMAPSRTREGVEGGMDYGDEWKWSDVE